MERKKPREERQRQTPVGGREHLLVYYLPHLIFLSLISPSRAALSSRRRTKDRYGSTRPLLFLLAAVRATCAPLSRAGSPMFGLANYTTIKGNGCEPAPAFLKRV